MQTTHPAASGSQTTASAPYADDSSRIVPAPRPFPMAAARAFYHLLVRRRVPISLILFTLILATEGVLGIGWHHVNLRSDIFFGAAVAVVLLGVGIRSWAAGTIRKNSELATSGAYSLCRHPLYLGSFLMSTLR